jgi:hypothetical protein
MAGRERNRNTAGKDATPAERQQAERDVQLAIYRLQDSAYANLRNGVAVTSIVLGLFIGYDAISGSADGARLLPNTVCLPAALLGIAYFATRSRPRLSMQLLIAAAVTLVVGLASLRCSGERRGPIRRSNRGDLLRRPGRHAARRRQQPRRAAPLPTAESRT